MTKLKLPKTVLGVKIPKELRRSLNEALREAGWLTDLVGSDLGRLLLAEAIIAAAGAAAARIRAHRPGDRALPARVTGT